MRRYLKGNYPELRIDINMIDWENELRGRKEVRKEGTCLFDINKHNTEYTSVKIMSEDSH